MVESQLEARLVQGVKALGGIAYKFVSPGNRGVPDRLVVLPGGRLLFAELKADGGRLSRLQAYQLESLRRLGAEVWAGWGENGVQEFLDACRRYVKGEAGA
mgnify:FL=1